jgi:hypothetical protein
MKSFWACEYRDECMDKEACNFWFDRSKECFIREVGNHPDDLMIHCDECSREQGDTVYIEIKERRYNGNTEIKKNEDEGVHAVRPESTRTVGQSIYGLSQLCHQDAT